MRLTSALLDRSGFSNAFFTRKGGVSPAPWASLNFATNTGDTDANVGENVARAARELGVDPSRIYWLSQVHGRAARILQGDEDRAAVARERGDVTASRRPGVTCGVRMADCVPVLVGDRSTGAVAAIHSGWQGTVKDVVAAGIEALREAAGGPGDLVAAIGPHIEVCCFEVGDDVAAELASCSPATGVVDRSRGPRPHVDLRRIVRAQLVRMGVDDRAIDDVRGCTKHDADRFFSYRRDGEKSGRHLAAIVAGFASCL
jgi:hypothetical protein